MPRIRYLKPEFFTDEDLCELPFQTRLTFAGLWCHADKSGRLEYRPRYLKAMIFPYDNIKIEKELEILSNGKGFIDIYEIENKQFIQIIHWDEHQKPHHTEKDSQIPPAPPKGMEKGMGKGNQLGQSERLRNGELTVKEPLLDKYGVNSNIKLTEEQHKELFSKFKSKAQEFIDSLSYHIASKGDKYKSHYMTILNWERNGWFTTKKEDKFL